jgi:hypothetical protein
MSAVASIVGKETWTLERLMAMTSAEAVALFRTLPSAGWTEMNGEYRGYLPNGGSAEAVERQKKGIFNENTSFGCWLGKSFSPVTAADREGEGYNYCRKPGNVIVRHNRYSTYMGPSHVDGQHVYIIRYAAFVNGSGNRDLTDEVRVAAPGLYLCVSTTRADNGGRNPPGAFILAGPEHAYVGVDDPALEKRRA